MNPSTESVPSKPPRWEPEEHPDYDRALALASLELLAELRDGGPSVRRAHVLDPREMHRRLYENVTPPGYAEYAGTFRGTVGTSLEGRDVYAASTTGASSQGFQAAMLVPADMAGFYAKCVVAFFDKPPAVEVNLPADEAGLFYVFGRIHPFLNGNGHVQRLVFAACVFERPDVQLSPAWSVHPRPYEREFLARLVEGKTTVQALVNVRSMLNRFVHPRAR